MGVQVGRAGGDGVADEAAGLEGGEDLRGALLRATRPSVWMWTSGLSGASYGSLTPVNSLISPENALA